MFNFAFDPEDYSFLTDRQNPLSDKNISGLLGAPQKGGMGLLSQGGLMALAASLLQNAGPKTMPRSMGQALGDGIMPAMQISRQDREDRARAEYQNAMLELKKQRMSNPANMQDEAAIKRYLFRQGLQTDAERKTFDDMIRSQQFLNLGDRFAGVGVGGNVTSTLPINVKPGDRPEIRGAQTDASERAKAAVEKETADAKQTQKSGTLIGFIDEAERLLPQASGSLMGTGWNAAKRGVGYSDETTKANQQLKLISGWMVSNVPRMEGPQSNYDVQNYMTMAATVGDSTVPVGDRMAALKTLRLLQQKYQPATTKNAPSGGIKFLGFE